MKDKLKNKKGITMVALVVTVIVLIILAGVSVNLLLSENGIIQKAKDTSFQEEKTTLVEQIKLSIVSKQLEKRGTLTKADLELVLSKYGEVNKEDEEIVSLTPTGKNYEIPISEIYTGRISE